MYLMLQYILLSHLRETEISVDSNIQEDNKEASYGHFAFAVVKSYIFFCLASLFFPIIIDKKGNFYVQLLIVISFGTLAYISEAIVGLWFKKGTMYGLRGWSNIREDTEPKIVLAVLCWPIFLVWLASWPARKIYSILKNHYKKVYLDE